MQRNSRVGTLAHLSYPDFGDGVVQAFAVLNVPECDGVELSLVEVGHGSVARLLAQRLGRLQSVLKGIPGPKTVPLLSLCPFNTSLFSHASPTLTQESPFHCLWGYTFEWR